MANRCGVAFIEEEAMSATRGVMVIADDTSVKGIIRNCQQVEIFGLVEGEIAAQNVIIREGGRFIGKLRAEAAEIHGNLQGQTFVKHLMRIGRTGTVTGKVQYGQLAMDIGAVLTADVRNVPPAIFGDLEVTVQRGGSVEITLADLNAVDPDDASSALVFAVSNSIGGMVETAGAPGQPTRSFTQADLEGRQVAFRHDGSSGQRASFDVVVTDQSGAISGDPKTVHVLVR